jgi:hypothetical protein
MHVGLNLIYLVPEETGGMEVYARELIPALLAAAGRFGDGSGASVSRIGGRGRIRFTAFVNREPPPRAGRGGSCCPP